ncbi:MAG: TIGR04211 family SH3 domain-containing protein [Pseudomonadota bacterium]
MIQTPPGRALFALLTLGAWLSVSLPASARTGYINDELEVTLRTGESTRNSIIRMLSSGERLDVLSTNEETGYARVTTEGGTEGFVLARFVTYQPIARDQLAIANQRLARNAERIAELEAELASVKGDNADYSASQSNLQSDNTRLTDELNDIRRTAANAIQTAEQNRTLTATKANLENQIQTLQAQNATLSARSRQVWFMAGAGTLILGIMAGLVLPRLKLKRRSKWGDL